MLVFIFIGLAYLVYIDADTLRRQNPELYAKILRYSPKTWVVLFIILFIAAVPVYLTRRRRFEKELKTSVSFNQEPTDKNLTLLSDAAGLTITWLFFVEVGYFVLQILELLHISFEAQLSEMVVFAIFSLALMVVLIYVKSRESPHRGFLEIVAFQKRGRPLLKIIFIPAVLGVGLAFLSAKLMAARQVFPATPLDEILSANESSSALLLFLGFAILVAPLLEELIFRGYFFTVISQIKGDVFAIYFISILFAFLHVGQYWGDWSAIAAVTALGFVLTWLRFWSGSTIASMVTHYAYNFSIAIIPAFFLIFSNCHYFQYQMLYDHLGAADKERLLVENIRRQPKFKEAYNDLAWLYAQENKNLDEALALAEKALGEDPDNIAYLDTKAEILYQLGRFEEAVKIEEEVVRGSPSTPFFQKQLNKFKEALSGTEPAERTIL